MVLVGEICLWSDTLRMAEEFSYGTHMKTTLLKLPLRSSDFFYSGKRFTRLLVQLEVS